MNERAPGGLPERVRYGLVALRSTAGDLMCMYDDVNPDDFNDVSGPVDLLEV